MTKPLDNFKKCIRENLHTVTEINRRHRTAEKMTTTVKQLQQDLWSSESEKQAGMGYTVRQISDCSTCRLRCSNCSACIHMYTCTCLDSITHTTVCKHIHFIHKHRDKQEEKDSFQVSNKDGMHEKWDTQYFTSILGSHSTVLPILCWPKSEQLTGQINC